MKKIIIFTFCLLTGTALFAQDAKFQAMFIYNFTRTLQWPATTQKNDFVIGVVGDTDIFKELESFTKDKKVRGIQKIRIKKIKVSDATNCQIIVISKEKNSSVPQISSATKGKHTLLISEDSRMTEKGAGIAFAKDKSGIVKYLYQEKNITDQGISVSTSFREVGEKNN